MKLSPRVLGKGITYLGLLITGMGVLGIVEPAMQLQRSPRMMAEVVGNDIAYKQPGVYLFRLQLKWMTEEGERRTTITTPVRAATEDEARKVYRGGHYQSGQVYQFFASPDNPERVQPFRGYDFATFGKPGMLAAAGVLLFLLGMAVVKRAKAG